MRLKRLKAANRFYHQSRFAAGRASGFGEGKDAWLGASFNACSTAFKADSGLFSKKYISANSNLISDRLVEPIRFTENLTSICAYEIASGKNKYFNIERISEVQLLNTNFKFENLHKFELPDPFGFSDHDGPKINIDLRLNLRACTLLKEEFPLCAPFITHEPKTNTYRLLVAVNNTTPLKRFILGLQNDVEVLGGKEYLV